jgi:hypothetical protein
MATSTQATHEPGTPPSCGWACHHLRMATDENGEWFSGDAGRTDDEREFLDRLRQEAALWTNDVGPADTSTFAWECGPLIVGVEVSQAHHHVPHVMGLVLGDRSCPTRPRRGMGRRPHRGRLQRQPGRRAHRSWRRRGTSSVRHLVLTLDERPAEATCSAGGVGTNGAGGSLETGRHEQATAG